MPRLIPRLASLLTPRFTPTSLHTPISSLIRSPPTITTSIPSRLLTSTTASPRLSPFTRPSSSLFTFSSPRSSILSLLPSSFRQTQMRTLTYGTTYQPSQRKRKRKYGFLARLKGGRLGQAILARRRIRGRRFLSH